MGRSADRKEKKNNKKSRKVATPNISDVESVANSSTSLSDDDLEGKPVLDQLLAEPRKLKADPPLMLVKEIGELPVLQLFSHYLKSFEGAREKNERDKITLERWPAFV